MSAKKREKEREMLRSAREKARAQSVPLDAETDEAAPRNLADALQDAAEDVSEPSADAAEHETSAAALRIRVLERTREQQRLTAELNQLYAKWMIPRNPQEARAIAREKQWRAPGSPSRKVAMQRAKAASANANATNADASQDTDASERLGEPEEAEAAACDSDRRTAPSAASHPLFGDEADEAMPESEIWEIVAATATAAVSREAASKDPRRPPSSQQGVPRQEADPFCLK